MSDFLIGLLLTTGIIIIVLGIMYYISVMDELGWNPLTWRARQRGIDDLNRIHRISLMEHDLGYTPCSDDRCYSCKRMLKERGTDYTDQFARMVYNKQLAYTPPP